jgi:exodeoxyribonuclease-3
MKIVTWNCNGALRKKLPEVDALNTDVLVIQECEDPLFYKKDYLTWAGDYLWVGTNKNKGIGVFPKNGNRVTKLSWHGKFTINGLSGIHSSICWSTSDLRLFLPFSVNDGLIVLAVWTKGNDNEAFGYVGQLWKYLQIHGKDLSGPSTMIVGDLNSNAIWDKEDRWWSHTGVVAELSDIGILSLYHQVMQEEQGSESTPTFYVHRNLRKPYHIDYAFTSSDLVGSSSVEVGKSSDWLHLSDHMPVIVTVRS